MGKRVLISLVALMSLGAIWSTDAGAGPTCLKWITAGGSGMCAAWSTKGVQVELTFEQDCGPEGSACQANVTANADAGNAVALCKNDSTGKITRRDCPNAVSFSGQTFGCEPSFRHEQDDTGTGGEGHNMDKHEDGCKATIILEPVGTAACTECGNPCGTGETCVDVTPVEMDTTVDATNAFDFGLTAQTASACSGPDCFFAQHCSINPKKIEFIYVGESEPTPPGASYQCNLTCVGSECSFIE